MTPDAERRVRNDEATEQRRGLFRSPCSFFADQEIADANLLKISSWDNKMAEKH